MPLFHYRAVDSHANIITGRMSSRDEIELERGLAANGILLIHVEKMTMFDLTSIFTPKFTSKELLDFTYMLKLIVNSGISIITGLNNINNSKGSRGLRFAAATILQGIESGQSISESMQNSPTLFPAYYVQVVRAGEISGSLGESLELLMNYISWRIEFRKTVRGGLIYPVILLTVMSSAMIIIFTFVFPKLLKVLTKLGGEIPLATRIVMSISEFMSNYILIIVPAIIVLIILFNFIWKTERGRYAIDSFILRLPVIGELVAKIDLSRYFKIVATLHTTGIAVEKTFSTGAEVVENQVMARKLRKVPQVLSDGKSIFESLSDIDHMPAMVLDIIALSERTGDLDGALNRVGGMLDKEVPERLKKFMTYFEPLTIVLLGGMALILLMSIFLPIYKTIGMIKVR